jgi:hypothetical protein
MTKPNPYQDMHSAHAADIRIAQESAARTKALARIERFMAESKQTAATGDLVRRARLERALDWLELRVQQNFGY